MSVQLITKTETYLTFTLAEEVYAVDVSKVREVLELTKITKVPRTPDFMTGVINLRGNVVPVVDMRLKFGMLKTENTIDTCVVVMEVSIDKDTTVLGALVDAVEEVIDLDPDQIEPAPHIGTSVHMDFIMGMGKRDTEFIIILDIDKVFTAEELSKVHRAKDKSSLEAVTAS